MKLSIKMLNTSVTASLLLSLLTIYSVEAKIKVVDQSAKKSPSWIDTTDGEYIITTATAADLKSAQDLCMDDVRAEIISSVAQNVESSSAQNISQTTMGGEITDFLSTYTTSSQSTSANVPFLTGVSISKVEESYWEKRVDTDTDKESYVYSVKYPFSRLELKKLIAAFDKRDKEMSAKLERLKQEYQSVSSVAGVDGAVMDLKALSAYFFDSVRKGEATALCKKYENIYKEIYLKEVENRLGEYRFKYQFDGRDFTISTRPKVSSETLSAITTTMDDSGVWSVKYSFDTCEADEQNFATITTQIKAHRSNDKFYADVKSDKLQIVPTQTVFLTGYGDGGVLESVDIRINMRCNVATEATLYQVTLDVPGLSQPLFVDNLKVLVSGVGEQSVVVKCTNRVKVVKGQSNRLNMLKGSLSLYDSSEKLHKIAFSLPFRCDW